MALRRVSAIPLLLCLFLMVSVSLLTFEKDFMLDRSSFRRSSFDKNQRITRNKTTPFGSSTAGTTTQYDKPPPMLNRRITAIAIQDLPYNGWLVNGDHAFFKCAPGEKLYNQMAGKWGGQNGPRIALPVSLQKVLNFGVRMRTSLRILLVGNSLSGQNSDGLEEALCSDGVPTRDESNTRLSCQAYNLLEEDNRENRRSELRQILHLPDDGVLIHWGHTGLISRKENKFSRISLFQSVPNISDHHKHTNQFNTTHLKEVSVQSNVVTYNHGIDDDDRIDTLVFNIPLGHVSLEAVTESSIREAIATASDKWHCSSVLFFTIPWGNNMVTDQLKEEWERTNAMMRSFVHNYTASRGNASTVQHVEYIDFAAYSVELAKLNALHLNISTHDLFSLRLMDSRWKVTVAHMCGKVPSPRNNSRTCQPNMFQVDGMHWCQETAQVRLTATQACVLGCIYNLQEGHHSSTATTKTATTNTNDRAYVRQCSDECNREFLQTLQPLRKDMELSNYQSVMRIC